METTTPIGHPRRLFAVTTPKVVEFIASPVDCASCVKPSSLLKPALAPSPRSMNLATHIEISTLESDLAVLTRFVQRITDNPSEENSCEEIFLTPLAPLRDALIVLANRRAAPPTIKRDPLWCSSLDNINVLTEETTEMVETPRRRNESVRQSMDPNLMLSDMEHLRTIQKEVRSLFNKSVASSNASSLQQYPSSACTPSLQTATRISRVLGASPDRLSRISHTNVSNNSFSHLTLSPDEHFDKENPWFRGRQSRRSGSLPPPRSASRVIPNEDDSQTVLALEAAMAARRRAPSPGAIHRMDGPKQGSSELVSWLRKQASNSKGLRSQRRFDATIYRN